MTASKNIGHLRVHLFNQLDMLCDLSKPVDLDRARMVCETSKQLIDTARVEIECAQVLKGALNMPFIEDQDGGGERPYFPERPKQQDLPAPATPQPKNSADRMQEALRSGPPADHPWRGLGTRVHRLEH